MTCAGVIGTIKSTNVRVIATLTAGVLVVSAASAAAQLPGPEPFGDHAARAGEVAFLLNRGAEYVKHGRLEAARYVFEEATRLDPMGAVGPYNLGVTLVALGKVEDAIKAYRVAIRRDPALGEALVNIGVEHSKLGRHAEAVAYLAKATRVAPRLAAAHHNLGVVLVETGRLDDALGALRRARALAPDDPMVARALAASLFNAGVVRARRQRWREAIDHYRAALDVDGELDEARYNLVLALTRLGRHAEAREIVQPPGQ